MGLAVMPSVEVVGVYELPEARQPCHLIALIVRDSQGFDLGAFTQADPDQPRSDWQAPYNEQARDASGESALYALPRLWSTAADSLRASSAAIAN
jgi:hypothetical protein